jgi:hypothetical protein
MRAAGAPSAPGRRRPATEGGQVPLRIDGGGNCVLRSPEGREEQIPLGVHLPSAVRGERGAEDAVVLGQSVAVARAELLQQARRAFDVRKEERDGPARKVDHDPPSLPRPGSKGKRLRSNRICATDSCKRLTHWSVRVAFARDSAAPSAAGVRTGPENGCATAGNHRRVSSCRVDLPQAEGGDRHGGAVEFQSGDDEMRSPVGVVVPAVVSHLHEVCAVDVDGVDVPCRRRVRDEDELLPVG